MDDFLQNYEVSGGKMRLALPGSGAEKLQSLRLAMGRGECMTVEDSGHESKVDDIHAVVEENGKRERWDVETVLTTYTNLENHPRLIKTREERKVPKIRLDPKTGFPVVDGKSTPSSNVSSSLPDKAAAPRTTARRPREESSEEKRERKRTVKAEKQARRIEKKEKREQFSIALKQQSQVLARKDAQVRKL